MKAAKTADWGRGNNKNQHVIGARSQNARTLFVCDWDGIKRDQPALGAALSKERAASFFLPRSLLMPQCSEALLLFFFRVLCRKELSHNETFVREF